MRRPIYIVTAGTVCLVCLLGMIFSWIGSRDGWLNPDIGLILFATFLAGGLISGFLVVLEGTPKEEIKGRKKR